MTNQDRLNQFYEDVKSLDLKFPVMAIVEATGYGKSTVSQYLRKKLEPSAKFMDSFYSAFEKSLNKVSRATLTPIPGNQGEVLTGLMVQLMQTQNRILEEMKEDVKDRVKRTEETVTEMNTNLTFVLGKTESLQYDLDSGRTTVLQALSRLEGKDENALVIVADKLRESLARATSKRYKKAAGSSPGTAGR